MPTQEQINAATVELQIASDNYNRAQNRIDQYDRIFNSYMNMSDEKKRDPRIVSAMQNAIADYNNLKLERTTNIERMNNAQVALNEYNAQAAAQQQAATQRGGERRRVINRNPNPNNGFDTTGWINDYGTMVSPDGVTRIYPNGGVGFSEPRLYSEAPYTPYTPANQTNQNNMNFGPQFGANFNNQPRSNNNRGNNNTNMTTKNQITYTPTNNQNLVGAGNVAQFNPNQYNLTGGYVNTTKQIPAEIQAVHNSKGNAYLKGMRDLEKMGYKVFNQKATKDGVTYDLRSWKNVL